MYPSDWLTWAQGTLAGIGAPETPANLSTLWNWSNFESGSAVMRWDNPLNTTQYEPGAFDQNSVGVKQYPDVGTGILATVQTLLNGRYPNIVGDLRGSVPQSQWGNAAQDLSTWGSGTSWLGLNAAGSSAPSSPTQPGVCDVPVVGGALCGVANAGLQTGASAAGAAGDVAGGLASIGKGIAGLPAGAASAAGDFLTAGVNDVGVFMQRQVVALAVAAVVLLVLFLG